MKSFKDLGIDPPSERRFIGEKIKILKILNKEIIVHYYKIEPSKLGADKGDYLTLQISIGDKKHVIFTGATGLITTIKKTTPEDFPFTTTIIEEDDRYEFS